MATIDDVNLDELTLVQLQREQEDFRSDEHLRRMMGLAQPT